MYFRKMTALTIPLIIGTQVLAMDHDSMNLDDEKHARKPAANSSVVEPKSLDEMSMEELMAYSQRMAILEKIQNSRTNMKLGDIKVQEKEQNLVKDKVLGDMEIDRQQEEHRLNKIYREKQINVDLIGKQAGIISNLEESQARIRGIQLDNSKKQLELTAANRREGATIWGRITDTMWTGVDTGINPTCDQAAFERNADRQRQILFQQTSKVMQLEPHPNK